MSIVYILIAGQVMAVPFALIIGSYVAILFNYHALKHLEFWVGLMKIGIGIGLMISFLYITAQLITGVKI